MKASITREGVLSITADNSTESYALTYWMQAFATATKTSPQRLPLMIDSRTPDDIKSQFIQNLDGPGTSNN